MNSIDSILHNKTSTEPYMKRVKYSYCFDDVLLIPKYSNISSRKNISLETNISSSLERNLKLKLPLISSPMDTVTGSKMAISMALNGGLGIIHRFMDEEEQLENVKTVKRYVQYIFTDPYTIEKDKTISELKNKLETSTNVKTFCVVDNNKLIGLITNRDLSLLELYKESDSITKIMTPIEKLKCLKISSLEIDIKKNYENYLLKAHYLMLENRVQKVPIIFDDGTLYGVVTEKSIKYYFNNQNNATLDKYGRLCCGIAMGVQSINWNHIDKLVEYGVDILCVDVANGHNQNCLDAVKQIRNRYKNKVLIMAGNVCTGEGLLKLSEVDVDCVRIGIGNGSICSTRLQTGNGLGQFTSVNDCMETKIKYNLTTKLICDGGSLGKIGNKVKALASGSDAIMLGRSLACCYESPGVIINRNGKQVKYYRGMASKMASLSKSKDKQTLGTAEGVDGIVEVKGSVNSTLVELTGGIKSGLSYQGCKSLKELNELRVNNKIDWGLSTSIGLTESGIRIKTF